MLRRGGSTSIPNYKGCLSPSLSTSHTAKGTWEDPFEPNNPALNPKVPCFEE
jgi:hypothetical protein